MSANEDPINGYQAVRRSLQFYFAFQSQDIEFSDWISLLTLCLAPLVAHIFVGAPEPVVVAKPSPRWRERILHFNPTSIYWRYYAITIRLARAQSWSADETAATNAIFWVGGKLKWDGSEAIMTESKNNKTEEAPRRRIPLVSASALKTVIVTLQGIQAAYDLAKGLSLGGYALTVALPNIFRPLAIAGLFRLPASLWLTDDYHYKTDSWKAKRLERHCPEEEPASTPPPKLHSWKYLLVIVLRAVFLIPTMALLVLAAYYFKPNPRVTAGTASTLLTNILYVIFLMVTLVTTSAYTIRGESNTTVIPCINSTWYMFYTYLLFFYAFVLFILTALQTRKTSCGQYTTYPAELGLDHFLCTNVSVSSSAIN